MKLYFWCLTGFISVMTYGKWVIDCKNTIRHKCMGSIKKFNSQSKFQQSMSVAITMGLK